VGKLKLEQDPALPNAGAAQGPIRETLRRRSFDISIGLTIIPEQCVVQMQSTGIVVRSCKLRIAGAYFEQEGEATNLYLT